MRLTRHDCKPSYRSERAKRAARCYAIAERIEKYIRFPNGHRSLRELIAQACGEDYDKTSITN